MIDRKLGYIIDNLFKKIKIDIKKENIEEIKKKIDEYLGDKTTDECLFKFLDIPENDRLRNYQFFKKAWDYIWLNSSNKENKEIYDIFSPAINNSKVFEIDDSIVQVLHNTESKETESPFQDVIIDCDLKIFDRNYHGIHIGEYVTDSENKNVKKDIVYRAIISIYTRFNEELEEREFQFDFFDLDSVFKQSDKLDKYQKGIKNFVFSFLNFINEPEVEVIERPFNPKNNERRKSRGLISLPPQKTIRVTGLLKEYLGKIEQGLKIQYNYRFWVRGHYLHFRNKKRFHRLYALEENKLREKGYQTKNGVLIIWKKPFIKGEGILLDKIYLVKK